MYKKCEYSPGMSHMVLWVSMCPRFVTLLREICALLNFDTSYPLSAKKN